MNLQGQQQRRPVVRRTTPASGTVVGVLPSLVFRTLLRWIRPFFGISFFRDLSFFQTRFRAFGPLDPFFDHEPLWKTPGHVAHPHRLRLSSQPPWCALAHHCGSASVDPRRSPSVIAPLLRVGDVGRKTSLSVPRHLLEEAGPLGAGEDVHLSVFTERM